MFVFFGQYKGVIPETFADERSKEREGVAEASRPSGKANLSVSSSDTAITHTYESWVFRLCKADHDASIKGQ